MEYEILLSNLNKLLEVELLDVFKNIISLISKDIRMKPVVNKIRIIKTNKYLYTKDIFNIGVERKLVNHTLILKLSAKYESIFPFILLREAFYCFLPFQLLNNKPIKIFINYIVELKLKKHPRINNWKIRIRKETHIIEDYNPLFNRIEKFFSNFQDLDENTIRFFFIYVRRNISNIENKTDIFYDYLANSYQIEVLLQMWDEDILETIRILIKIFYKKKTFKNLAQYTQLFKDFKKIGFIKTDLSTNKFTESLRWLKKYSFVSPSYQIYYKNIGINIYWILFQFDPSISKKRIKIVLKNFPFLAHIRFSSNGLSIFASGYLYLPKVYTKSLFSLLKSLKSRNVQTICIKRQKVKNNLNLNYFQDFHNIKNLINPNHQKYEEKFEIDFSYSYGEELIDSVKLSHLDFLILDRIRYYSLTGFGFEPSRRKINQLRMDYINDFLFQIKFIKKLRMDLELLFTHPIMQKDFISIIDKFFNAGIFYIKYFFVSILEIIKLLKKIVVDQNITSIIDFKAFIKSNHVNLFSKQVNHSDFKKRLVQKLILLYFNNKIKFEEEVKKVSLFSTILNNFFILKIFNVKNIKKIILDKDLAFSIYSGKKKKITSIKRQYKLREITINKVQEIINKYIQMDPPILKPNLINTIRTTHFAHYCIYIILKDTSQVIELIDRMKSFFPRLILERGEDVLSKRKYIFLGLYLPNLSINEKYNLISIFYNIFKKNIIEVLRFFSSGVLNVFSVKDYYDFQKGKFFYARDMFSQFLLLINRFLNKTKHPSDMKDRKSRIYLFTNENNLLKLARDVSKRNSRRQVRFNPTHLHELEDFHKNLSSILSNTDLFKGFKQAPFFNQYVQSIKFIPQHQSFGFSKYFLWFTTSKLEEINKKCVLTKNFLSLKHPIEIHQNFYSFLITYLFPYHTPNNSYLNWLLKSKKAFLEYILFFIKKVYHVLHFNYNLTSNGWNLNANHFNSFARKIIFKQQYNLVLPSMKEFDFDSISDMFFEPNSLEFKDLMNLYTFQPDDLKSFLAQEKHHKIDSFQNLNSKHLLFPYLELKNLDLCENFYFIIPNISIEVITVLIKIFGFFNYCFIYEIEGEIYINEMKDQKHFENGLFIKLTLPDCEFSEFDEVFHGIFDLLGIKRYCILNDLVEGKNFLKDVFKDLSFLNHYTPLKNLEWNDKDNIWVNYKLLDENFNFQDFKI